MALTPPDLRRQAEHCRHLAKSQFDERLRSTLLGMAGEFDREAEVAEKDEDAQAPATPRDEDSAR